LHEKSSQIGVTTFADTEQLLLADGGVFPRNYSHPGGELSTLAMAAMTAVAVTGPIPGMATSRWQASFSQAVFLISASASSMKKEGLLPVFKKLSYTHRKEYCRWITEAKKQETRLKRLDKAIEMLKKGVSTPG